MMLLKPKVAVADLTWFTPRPWAGVLVTFTHSDTEFEVGLTVSQARRLAKSLEREADRVRL